MYADILPHKIKKSKTKIKLTNNNELKLNVIKELDSSICIIFAFLKVLEIGVDATCLYARKACDFLQNWQPFLFFTSTVQFCPFLQAKSS
jgi:hypothetical protein